MFRVDDPVRGRLPDAMAPAAAQAMSSRVRPAWHDESLDEVLATLGATRDGLSMADARARLAVSEWWLLTCSR